MTINKNTNVSIALGLLAVVLAVAFRLFSEADLWFQMFSAFLGVIITIIITSLLLSSQTSSRHIRECVSSIVQMYSQCPGENGRKVLQDKELLLKNLFRIVDIFRQELYIDKSDFFAINATEVERDRENIAQAIKNFDYAYDYFMSNCKLGNK